MLGLLKDGTYLRYWLAVVVSFLGDAMTRITLIYLVARLTESPALISFVVIAQLLPTGVFGVFLGPLTDRFSKRVLLVGSDLARMVIVLAMIFALHSVWLLLLLTLLQGVGKAVFETARIASIPKFVGDHSIPAAVAMFQTTNHVLYLIGPAAGGLLIAVGSIEVVFVLDAATFLISGLLLGSIGVLREPRATRAPDLERYWRALAQGLRGIFAVPTLRFLCYFLIPVMIVLGLFTTNFNAQLLTVFDLSAERYGLAQAMFGGGSILGALMGPAIVRRYTSAQTLLLGSVALFALTLLVLVPVQWLTPQLGLVAVVSWCVLTGVGASLFQVPVANTMLRDLPEEIRGRGVGLMNTIFVTFTVVGVGIGGWMGSVFGVAESIVVAGGALLVAAVAFSVPFLRASRLDSLAEA